MNLNLVLIILMVVGACLCAHAPRPCKSFVIWCSIIFVLSVSLKSAYYGVVNDGGADTLSYIEKFHNASDTSFEYVWQQFIDRYFHGLGDYDIGYVLVEWIFAHLVRSYHIFSFFFILIFFIPFANVIYRYCNSIIEIFFAFLIYLALFHNLAMYGARQIYAIGMGLLFFLSYSEKKHKSAIICLVIGVTFHMTCLLVLLPFALSIIPEKHLKKIHFIIILLIPLVLVFSKNIIYSMGSFIGIERYANYGQNSLQGGAITYIFLSEALSIICLILTSTDCFLDSRFKYLYVMAPVFSFFVPLVFVDGTMMRVAAYSQIYISALFPYILNIKFGNKLNYYLVPAIAVLILLMVSNGYQPYYFFWLKDPIYLW